MNTCGTSLMMTMKGTVTSCSHQAETFDLLVPVNSFESCQKKTKPLQVVNLCMRELLTAGVFLAESLSHTLFPHHHPVPLWNLPRMFHLFSWWYIAHDLQKYIDLQHSGTRPSAGKIVSSLATFFFTRPSPDSRNRCESSHVKPSSVQVAAWCL